MRPGTMAPYKVPAIGPMDKLPLTATGKVKREVLRGLLA